MKANFNGMRRTATKDMNDLHGILGKILAKYEDTLLNRERDELIAAYNSAAQSVAMFNCLYDDSVDGDMNDLSDLDIARLEDTQHD